MKQLVELGKNADKFKAAGAEVIAVFREEQKEEEGLKAIVQKTSTTFTLALDNGKKNTSRYSTGNREFTGYVIDTKGMITKIFKGDLRNRATSDEILKALAAASKPMDDAGSTTKKEMTKGTTAGSAKKGSATKGSSKK